MVEECTGMYLKLDAAYWHHPEIRKIGFPGNVIFCALLCEAKLHGGRGGVLPAEFWDESHIRDVLRCDADISEGMARLEASRLVDVTDESVAITGWNKYQTDPTAAARQRKHREKSVTDVTVTSRCNGDRIGLDRIGEDRIGEETPTMLAAEALAAFLGSEMQKEKPGCKVNPRAWRADIEKLLRIDGVSEDRVRAVISWATHDEFWCANVRSGSKLRKQFDALELQMTRSASQPAASTYGDKPPNPPPTTLSGYAVRIQADKKVDCLSFMRAYNRAMADGETVPSECFGLVRQLNEAGKLKLKPDGGIADWVDLAREEKPSTLLEVADTGDGPDPADVQAAVERLAKAASLHEEETDEI